jgi:membrane protease YdiL (CAAX protease family)
MSTHTLYLDGAIVAAAAYPSGFGYSLYIALRGEPRQVSNGLLAALVLPCALVVPAVLALRPELIPLRGATVSWLVAALAIAPVALACESVIHGVVLWRTTRRLPRGITVPRFWRRPLDPSGLFLLALVAIGEEFFFRAIWLGVLIGMGMTMPLALALSSVAYGLNHLSFGSATVVAKSVTGLLYGTIYLAAGQSLVLPIVAHVLQNFLLLRIARRDDA